PGGDGTPRSTHEIGEGRFERLKRTVVIEMIRFDVQEAERVGTQLAEGAVAFVDLNDEVALTPVSVRAQAEHRRADEPSVVTTAPARDLDHHRRRGGLAVRAGEADDPLHR